MDKESAIIRSLELIENRISEKLTVGSIANAVYFSANHYQRLFRDAVGNSVMEYVKKRKLTLAGKALLESDASIIDIAVEYGFDSREGFTRSFKAVMGISPSEYRKSGIRADSINKTRERYTMPYSKTTDEIIRELNEFIVKAKETAQRARDCEAAVMAPYWRTIADKTDVLAGGIERTLNRISDIAQHPDEITNRFAIIKAIEDAAFELNIIVLNVNLTVSRSLPLHIEQQKPLCVEYQQLAHVIAIKAKKIIDFLSELAGLIISDMRKTAGDKIRAAAAAGKAAAEAIAGYDYIRNEVGYLARELEAKPLADITVAWLDDTMYKLRIIAFTAETDAFQHPSDKAMFEGIAGFFDKLREACDFFTTLITDEPQAAEKPGIVKFYEDVVYIGNILLFYVRGEAEKLSGVMAGDGGLPDDGQKAAFTAICAKINEYIAFARNASDESGFRPVADRLCAIKSDLLSLAGSLGDYSGPVRFLGEEFGRLADVVMSNA